MLLSEVQELEKEFFKLGYVSNISHEISVKNEFGNSIVDSHYDTDEEIYEKIQDLKKINMIGFINELSKNSYFDSIMINSDLSGYVRYKHPYVDRNFSSLYDLVREVIGNGN